MTNTDLKKAGLKVTTPRLKILELLEKSEATSLERRSDSPAIK